MKFNKINNRYNGPALEEEVLAFWDDNAVFERTLEQSNNRPLFTFNEGPPTANGKPGIHHVLARSFKDAFPRYKTMQGYHVPRKAGWDTHGLPVEHEIEKQLEIFRLVQSLHKDGLGYRRIAKVLNEKGLNTKEGHLWKNSNVYSVLKRYSERQDRLKFRRKKYPLVRGRMWMEFIK